MLGVARGAGQVVVAQGVLVAGAGRVADLLEHRDGNTSEPKIAGTFFASTWSISAATSCGVGSSKFDGWIAPMTFQP